jgi:tetratricopeptide (TPR) repeat protein
MSVIKAPFLGPRSVASAKKAVALDQGNPLGHIQFGNCYNYMPSFYGGSKTVALESYRKAEKLMEQDKGQTTGDWNYLNLLSLIGQTYEETGKFDEAKYYYDKILNVEPAFDWVKNGLLPGLAKKMKKGE